MVFGLKDSVFDVIFDAQSIGDGVEVLKSTPGSIFWMPRFYLGATRFYLVTTLLFGFHALYLVATLFCPQSLVRELDNEGPPGGGPELSSMLL